jgi:hypothetical protein
MVLCMEMDSAQPEINIAALKEEKAPRFKRKHVLTMLGVDVLVFILIFASLSFTLGKSAPTPIPVVLGQDDQAEFAFSEPTPSPTPLVIKNINPFNGLELTDTQVSQITHRPLAVMIDNSTPARKNHYNLNRADMVYEAVTEGGWTRFMPIFYSDQSNIKVMPVRSVRMHFLNNLLEYNDPLLYHVGGAFTPAEPRTNVVQKMFDLKFKTIYYYTNNHNPVLNEIYDPACAKDASIPGYSCKYMMTDDLIKKAKEVGYEDTTWEPEKVFEWKWKFDEKVTEETNDSGLDATKINYMFTMNKEFEAGWTYDADKDVYLRKTAGQLHMDKGTNEQFKTTTIVVQKVPHKLNVDDKLRAIVTTIGEGEAYIFSKGKAYEVTWKKDCDTCRTRYYNKVSDEEFTFSPGRIWVSITRPEEKINFN